MNWLSKYQEFEIEQERVCGMDWGKKGKQKLYNDKQKIKEKMNIYSNVRMFKKGKKESERKEKINTFDIS